MTFSDNPAFVPDDGDDSSHGREIPDPSGGRRAVGHRAIRHAATRRPLARAVPEPPITPSPAPWAAARFAGVRPWWRRPVTWSIAVGLVVGLVAGVVWVSSGPPTEQRARLAASYTAPVHVRPGTSYLRTRILTTGELEVTQWIASTAPVQEVTLRVPDVPGLAPGGLSLSHVVLAADGLRSTAIPVAGQPAGTWRYRTPVAREVYLRYRLSGAVATSTVPGRALAMITALVATTDHPLTSTTEAVVGANVLSLGCSLPTPSAPPTPCGVTSNGISSVRLYGAQQQSRVTAEVDFF